MTEKHCKLCGKTCARLYPPSATLTGAVMICPRCFDELTRPKERHDYWLPSGFDEIFGRFRK